MKCAIVLLSSLALPVAADEGMWLFNQCPKGRLKQKYSFDVSDGFLDHLRLSSLRIGGGSGSFVWVDAKAALNATVPLNFVSSCGVTGGNSGSPTVNGKGEIAGIVFDSNIESLPGTYLYSEEQARSVHVATQGIVEALRKVYQADALLKELGQ